MALYSNEDKSNSTNAQEYTLLDSFDFSNNPNESTLNFSSVTNVESAPSTSITTVQHLIQNNPLSLSDDEKDDEFYNDYWKSEYAQLSYDDQLESLTKELDMMELKETDSSIKDRIMSVKIEPPTDIRRRYESDGKRQIEKSRSEPMTIKLPGLNTCELKSNQSFWLQLDLITTKQNPLGKEYIHPYKLEYHENDLSKTENGITRVELTKDDIKNGIKRLARIGIIKIKLPEYTYQFKVYNPLSTEDEIDIFDDPTAKTDPAKAKSCRDQYHLQSSHIVCRLFIKQNNIWFMTDIECKTKVMEEKTQSTKRSTSLDTHKTDQINHSKPSKIAKTLPVTRVKNSLN